MEEDKTVTVTREELYEQVWTTPMSRLCRQYGISDVALAGICKAHRIPRPGVGYWMKRQHGKGEPAPKLPECASEEEALVTIRATEPSRQEESATDTIPYEEDVNRLLQKAERCPRVEVPTSLRGLHPLVHATWEGLKECNWPEKGLLRSHNRDRRTINVRVSKEQVTRAMCLLNALVRAVETVGGQVSVEGTSRWDEHAVITILGERVGQLGLREHYHQRPHVPKKGERFLFQRADYFPNGRFVLEAGGIYEDTSKRRVDDLLNSIVIDLVRRAGEIRNQKRHAEEARKRWEEEEKGRREREAVLQRQREELRARQRAEQARVDHLIAEANAWEKSQRVRAYISALEEKAVRRHGTIQEGGDVHQWLRWARQQANRIDPLTPSPPSVLDERV